MKVIFLGDSITDAGRTQSNGNLLVMGEGYALFSSAKLASKYPNQFEFENFGTSGYRVTDVYAGIKKDCWNHQPDMISILIGVNDVWHELLSGNGVDADQFYRVYRMLIEDTRKRLPNTGILLMEPFVLKGQDTEAEWEFFHREVPLRAEATKRLAEEFGLPFLPLQEKFDKACESCPTSYWLKDGVHPTFAGHSLIADAWLEAFESHFLAKDR